MASIIKVDAIQTTAGKPIVNSTGGVLQVISSTKTNAYTDNETSLTDIPGTDQDGNGRSSCVRHDVSGSFTTSAITCEVFYNDSYALADNNHNFGNVYGGLA